MTFLRLAANAHFSSVHFSCLGVSDSLQPHGLQHPRSPCPSPAPGVHPNPCPLSRWCHPIISSSVVPFSSHLQTFQVSGSFPMGQYFTSGGQSIGTSASASVLPMNIQGGFPLELTGIWSSWSPRDSQESSTLQFKASVLWCSKNFGAQRTLLYLWSNSHIHTWLLEKP